MRQRIGLAQALLGEPDLLILDEPQSGLDPLGRRQVREILLDEQRRGVTIVFSSHIVPDVEAVADRVAMIRHGRLTEIKDLRRRPPARVFRAVIGAPAGGALAALAAPEFTVLARDPERWTILADGPAALARLLAACDAAGTPVCDLAAEGGDLESEFLAGLASPAARPEVVAC